jgi:hypothetical protein
VEGLGWDGRLVRGEGVFVRCGIGVGSVVGRKVAGSSGGGRGDHGCFVGGGGDVLRGGPCGMGCLRAGRRWVCLCVGEFRGARRGWLVVAGTCGGLLFVGRPAGQSPAVAVPGGRCGARAPQTTSLASSAGRSLPGFLLKGCRLGSLRHPLVRPSRAVPGRRLPRRTAASFIDGRCGERGSCRCAVRGVLMEGLRAPADERPAGAAHRHTLLCVLWCVAKSRPPRAAALRAAADFWASGLGG